MVTKERPENKKIHNNHILTVAAHSLSQVRNSPWFGSKSSGETLQLCPDMLKKTPVIGRFSK